MIRIYGITQSRAFRPLWLLEELGVEYEHVRLDYRGADLNSPGFRALNPNGRVPTLVDGELVLWESMAIDLYLARNYGATTGLWPDDIECRCSVRLVHTRTRPAGRLSQSEPVVDAMPDPPCMQAGTAQLITIPGIAAKQGQVGLAASLHSSPFFVTRMPLWRGARSGRR